MKLRTITLLVLTSGILILSLGTFWSNGFLPQEAPWTVGPEGPPLYHFAKIQEAIDDSRVNDGDSILVATGTYEESISICKSVTLIGENKENTTIDCINVPGSSYVVRILSSNVGLHNFTIKNPHYYNRFGIQISEYRGLFIRNITISGNSIENCDEGIFIYNASEINIVNNEFEEDSYRGIHSEWAPEIYMQIVGNNINLKVKTPNSRGIDVSMSKNSVFSHNKITNMMVGIRSSGDTCSTFTNNELRKCTTGIMIQSGRNNMISSNQMYENELCIAVEQSSSSTISDNEIFDNLEGTGIEVSSGERNTITQNLINGTSLGINILSSINNSISDNFIYECSEACELTDGSLNVIKDNVVCSCHIGISTGTNSENNTIYHNSFFENDIQVIENSRNCWDNTILFGGNYWSDYEGEDENGDCFGDVPYVIDENNQDNYPLIVPRHQIPVCWHYRKGRPYDVLSYCIVHGNITVSRFHLDRKSKILSFNIIGHGYCNLTIPREVLDGILRVSINDTLVPYTIVSLNTTHMTAYFEYQTSIPLSVRVEAQIRLSGDINGDDKVNILDISTVAIHFGKELQYP